MHASQPEPTIMTGDPVWQAGSTPEHLTPMMMSASVPIPLETCRGEIGLHRLRDGMEVATLDAVARERTVFRAGDPAALIGCQITFEGSAQARWEEGRCAPQRLVAGQATFSLVPQGRGELQLSAKTGIRVVSCRFDPLWFHDLCEEGWQFDRELERATEGRSFDGVVLALADGRRLVRIARELLANPYQGAAGRLYFESRMLEAAACLVAQFSDAPAHLPDLTRREISRLHEARDRLLADLAAPPTLEALCRATAINKNKLHRGFRLLFGAPPFEILRDARLDHARFLLEDERLGLEEVADRAGYAHPGNLSHAFRVRFGISPSQCRGAGRLAQRG